MKNKRGISHIEMILSFVIFVGFLIFLFAIFRPFRVVSGGEVYLDVVERGIRNNVSADVDFQTLKINDELVINDCFCLIYDLEKVIVKNEFETVISAETGGNLCAESANKFFYISSSEEFPDSYGSDLYNSDEPDCQDLVKDTDYALGLFRTYSFYSNSKLVKLHSYTLSNYNEVKEQLGLPGSEDFSFSLRSKETNELILENTKQPGKGVRVLARDVPIQIVKNNGDFEYLILNIKVW